MTEAKPILVIYYLPDAMVTRGGKEISIYEMNEIFRDMFDDYHTLAIPSYQSADGSCEDVRLQVFHEKDITDIQYEELKQMVLESIGKGTGKINKQ